MGHSSFVKTYCYPNSYWWTSRRRTLTADPVRDARAIAAELKKFSPELATRERWLVLNKIDLMTPAEADKRCREIVRRLRWKGPVCGISGATRSGTRELCQAVMRRLDEIAAEAPQDAAAH